MGFENRLTEGSVIKQLIKFSLPLLLSNIVQALYSVADMLIVGWFSGTYTMSAVNIGGQITMVVTNFVIGLAIGGTVLIAQYIGAKKNEEVDKTIGTLFTLMGILAVFFSIFMTFFSDVMLKLLNTPEESYDMAKNYVLICMWGIIFVFGYNAISAILRGMGDSKRPLAFVGIASTINIILDIIFVGPLNMNATGAAIATIIAQATAMFLAIIYLKRNRFVFNFHHTSFRIHKDKLKLLLKVGIPSSAQNVIVGISFLVLTSIINDLGGVTASAAVGIVGKFNSFAILPAIAMSASVSAMSAQNIGAGLYDRAQKTLWSAITISFAISVAIFAFVQIFPEAILQAFKAEPDVIDIGVSYLRSFSYDYLIVPFAFCFNGLLNGSGYSIVSMTSSIVSSLVFRIPLVFLFARVLETGVGSLGYAAPIATVFASLIGGYFYFSGKWKKDKLKIKRS
ncbi:MAG: MATE family efflux transporter [Clostridia bacterium]|nr:MATE family efflux transporter [Clostridia bacterium]HPJ75328.1 MATE family efflux transporter [Clostridia bacterium]